jgi:type II secretory pathway pseudopilin PulG
MLIELVVVMAIITFVMVVVMTGQSSFNKTIILENTAYDIALTLRNAQTYGLGSRVRTNEGVIISTNTGYGVHFESATPSSLTLFADIYPSPTTDENNCHVSRSFITSPDAQPGDCAYQAAQDQKVVEYTLGNGITVSDFCVFNVSWSCSSVGLSSLDIVFSRPNPDVFTSTNGSYSKLITKVCLTIASPQGGTYFVSVDQSGRITASATSCL